MVIVRDAYSRGKKQRIESSSRRFTYLTGRDEWVWANSPIHGEVDRRGRKRERIISFGVSKASSLVSSAPTADSYTRRRPRCTCQQTTSRWFSTYSEPREARSRLDRLLRCTPTAPRPNRDCFIIKPLLDTRHGRARARAGGGGD